jgi:arylsulfatase A-like enzyme
MKKDKRPNILFLMTDQQRFDTLGCVNDKISTPNLDSLIADSVFFSNARCVNPSCVPSRAAIYTGKNPTACGCPQFVTSLPKTEKTFMKYLQESGYRTSVVGKQHFNGSFIDKGYDEEFIVDGHSVTYPDNSIKEYLKFLEENNVDRNKAYTPCSISGGKWNVDTKFHIDNYIGDKGKEWLSDVLKQDKTEQSDKPWFFCLSFLGPHHPYDGLGTEFEDLYDLNDMEIPDTSYEDLLDKPPQYRGMSQYSKIYLKDFSEKEFKLSKLSYYANISLIDRKVGEVIDILKDSGEYENTLIIYTSDHGDFMGDLGMVEKLQCLSDSLMRVPLFVKPPIKNYKGYKCSDEVLNIDIAATCLEVADIPIPSDMQNYSYNCYYDPSYKQKKRDCIYMEAGSIIGVLYNNIKIVHYLDRKYGELYDLNDDPEERFNLWNDDRYIKAKNAGFQLILNNLYKSINKWDVPWNYGTPEI